MGEDAKMTMEEEVEGMKEEEMLERMVSSSRLFLFLFFAR